MPEDNKIRTKDYDPENPRCDEQQLKFLKDCINEGPEGIKKWNDWYMIQLLKNKDFDIWLQKTDFKGAHMNGINLSKVHMEGVNLQDAHLGNANLRETHMEGANLMFTHLEGANLLLAHLEGADFSLAHLEGTTLSFAQLEGAKIYIAHMEGASLEGTNLKSANLMETHLEKARFINTNLKGADFSRAIVDSETLVWTNKIDCNTKFEAVGLDNMRIYPAIKQLLEYNIRRMNWKAWYEYKDWDAIKPEMKRGRLSRIVRHTVKWFWSVSDYGISTWRIIFWFFILSLFFAAVYSNISCWYPEGIVSNLTVEPHLPLWHYFILCILRPIYFSIVTMTTLGFGDMYANAKSIWGHLLLTIQVIFGYVLLGALVTRFAVLFTAGGPAGKFEKENNKS